MLLKAHQRPAFLTIISVGALGTCNEPVVQCTLPMFLGLNLKQKSRIFTLASGTKDNVACGRSRARGNIAGNDSKCSLVAKIYSCSLDGDRSEIILIGLPAPKGTAQMPLPQSNGQGRKTGVP